MNDQEHKQLLETTAGDVDDANPHGMVRPNSTMQGALAANQAAITTERERQIDFLHAVGEPDQAADRQSELAFDQVESLQRPAGAPAEQHLGQTALRIK